MMEKMTLVNEPLAPVRLLRVIEPKQVKIIDVEYVEQYEDEFVPMPWIQHRHVTRLFWKPF